MSQQFNQAGQFRDLVFVIVVVSVLGISVILDFLYVHFSEAHGALRWSVILLMIGNILALGSGLVCFIGLKPNVTVTDWRWLEINYILILGAVVIGLLTEIVISSANHTYG
jgi:cytochrome c oxidase subunit IV